MATATKKQAARTDGKLDWPPNRVRTMYASVNKGIREGRSKLAMFREIAEELQSEVPDITPARVSARYYYHADALRKQGKRTPVDPSRMFSASATTRRRDSVVKAMETLAETASPAAIKPKASKAKASKAPKAKAHSSTKLAAARSPLEAVAEQLASLQEARDAAELRAAKAEAVAEKLRNRLAQLHKLTA